MQFNRFTRPKLLFQLVSFVLICGLLTSSAQARLVGKISKVRPLVETRMGQNASWKGAAERANIEPGHYIHTGRGGSAELHFTNSTSVVLNANTQVFIEGDDTPAKPLSLRVFGALSQIIVRSKGTMPIRAAAAIAAPRGTEYMVTLTDENTMVLTVAEGSVRFYNAQGEQIVGVNQQSTAKVGQAPTPPIAVDASGLMQWAFDVGGLPVEFELPNAKGEVATLQAAATLNPNDTAAQMALGEALRQSGDANGAVTAYQKAVQLAPSDTSRVGLAVALLARNDVTAAGNALAANPNSALELAARGLVQLRANDVNGAVQSLSASAQRDPQLPQAPSLLALAHLTQNQTNEAVADGRRAVQIAPDSSQAQSALSLALFYAGQTKEASRAANRAVQLNPESPLALLVQGQALLAAHQTDAAREALQQAETQAPNLPLIQNNLAVAYNRLDMPQRAAKAYRRVLDKTPNSAAAHAGLGGVLLANGQPKEALAELQRAIQLEPNNVLARANMALYQIEMGDFAAAKQAAATLGDDPASGLLYIRLSDASLFLQQLFEAQEFARRAVKLLPDSAQAHYQLGRVYREQERSVQAEQEFRQAVILDPQLAAARFALGLAREVAESGGDISRPLSAIASNSSGPRQALNIQNLQTPGAEDRLQAAIQDPSVVRSASRAFGDNQIEGSYGEGNTNNIGLSHLQDINNRRGSFGASISRNHTDGIRPTASLTQENFGVFAGSKKPDTPSGFFALGQVLHSKFGGETGPTLQAPGTALTTKRTVPFTVLGYNDQPTENQRTRFLLAFDDPKNDSTSPIGSFLNTKGRSIHGEFRHDLSVGTNHNLSLGASLGTRRFDLDLLAKTPPGFPFPLPDFRRKDNRRVEQETVYLRDAFRLSSKLSVTAEMKLVRVENSNTVTSFGTVDTERTTTVGVPNLVVAHHLGRGSELRFRAHGLIGGVSDFDLLAPTDVFLYSFSEVPSLDLNSRGSSYELELSHQLSQGTFLRLGAFQRNLKAVTLDSGDNLTNTKFRSVRALVEGSLTPSTTYFASTKFNNTKGSFTFDDGSVDTNFELTRVPRFSMETGLQFLNHNGWFMQPTVAYIGSRLQAGNSPRTKLSGFTLVNLRVGKRAGLRSTIFVEATNLTNQNYVGPNGFQGEQQPGRQFQVGIEKRF